MRGAWMTGYGLLLAAVAPVFASDKIDRIDQLGQSEFRALSEDLGAAFSYKAVVSVEATGVAGFDLGAEVTATKLQHRAAWDQASSGSAPPTLYIPKVHAHKGLPGGFDVGASYATAPTSDINVVGAELRYALVRGDAVTPAVGLRATYTRLNGVDQLDLVTRGLDIGVSKGFALVTPYAGVGRIWVDSSPRDVATLTDENFSENKYYLGARLNLGLGSVTFEGDRTGTTTSYSVKLGVRL